MITVVVGKEIEKIKGEFESVINGMNMVGKIPYDVYSELFDVGTDCIQKAYELDKAELEKENAETYKEVAMDFGMAIVALKRGETVARKGWNGKGMFLTLQNGSEVDGNNMRNEGARNYYANCKCRIAPHIDMKAADGTYVVGWLASQTDMLAEDWEIAKPVPLKDEVHVRKEMSE